mgnify:CR=1 FL=1|jgi:GT2 family glycosyltransferase|tara:strand:- start:2703 stop:3533 length:831 start_codon:yes stop_codon:yes gene_type:complete
MNDIIIITVHYNKIEYTQNFVESVCNNIFSEKTSIIIVNNDLEKNSQQKLEEMVSKYDFEIELLNPEQNLYYWRGAALGLDYISNKYPTFNGWIIICNNDIQFDYQFFKNIRNKNVSQYHVIAPRIISKKDDRDQNPFLVRPLSLLYRIYFRLYVLNKWLSKLFHFVSTILNKLFIKQQSQRGGNKPREIYAPHGSCIIFSKRFFNNGGYLDTGFTMYGEEISTAEIARNNNMQVMYLPDLIVLHDEHKSTDQFSWPIYFAHVRSTYRHLFKTYSI